MSKVSETKDRYGFKQKPVWPTCSNCCHFTMETEQREGSMRGTSWTKEFNLRCRLGGFKVGKSATCNEHSPSQKDRVK